MPSKNIAEVGPISDAIANLAAERRKAHSEPEVTKEIEYRHALRSIAEHFEFFDLSGDDSAIRVIRIACRALGWTIGYDQYGQIKYDKD